MPILIRGRCVAPDDELYSNMDAAIARGYPDIGEMLPARDGLIALIGSGPSVKTELDRIRQMQAAGVPVVAIKDAHDWLIENGVIPDYAFAVDPQEHRWNCFRRKHPFVHYVIASQCNPAMFDHLAGLRITLWHPYIHKGQDRPKGKKFIGGATTSGLRAIVVFYTMGWRRFALFGYDSCLDGETLRVNGDRMKSGEQVVDIRLKNGEVFYCNPAMAHQAQHFQEHFDYLPGLEIDSYGDGLITSILKLRAEDIKELETIRNGPHVVNDRLSFIHAGPSTTASYRYRAAMPSDWLGASINDLTADTLIFSKPQASDVMEMERVIARGGRAIVDICDDHLEWTHYQDAIRRATIVTCSTRVLAQRIWDELRVQAFIIPEAYEFPEAAPHCSGTKLLWFGNKNNAQSMLDLVPELMDYDVSLVSNFDGAIPWSHETMLKEFAKADIVILPQADFYKSANRAVEAIRQGCFVVAAPHPAHLKIPGIWSGDIKEGIEWTSKHLREVNQLISRGQKYVTDAFSPKTVAAAWRTVLELPTTSDAETEYGLVGSAST